MISRRSALKYLASITGISIVGANKLVGAGDVTSGSVTTSKSGKSLRLAHITDVHIFEKHDAEKWFKTCLEHIQNQDIKPEMIINTGDSIMDSLKQTKDAAQKYWDLWNKIIDESCKLPIKHALGNHDIWGWELPMDSDFRKDAESGIPFGVKNLGMGKPYYSFELGKWHIVMLNSTFPVNKPGYTARLDDQQFHWLEEDLSKTPSDKPVMVFSHIPIMTATVMPNGRRDEEGNLILGNASLHSDLGRIVKLFKKHPNVKGCHSGHTHMWDEIILNNVRYCNNGAVSGAWWKGSREDVPPGYTLLDLHDDGTFDRNYVDYGWKPTAADLKG